MSLCGEYDAAKDLMSETVLAALEGYTNLKNKDAFKSYLFGIASNLHKKSFRRAKFHGEYDNEGADKIQEQHSNAEAQTDLNILYQALNYLSDEQKETIILYEINGFKMDEIADLHCVSLSAVKQRLSRGREKLAQLLKEPSLAKKRVKKEIIAAESNDNNFKK